MTLFDFLLCQVFTLLCLGAAISDYRKRTIPNPLALLLLVCGIAACFAPPGCCLYYPLWYRLVSLGVMAAICLPLWWRDAKQLGGGDVKLLLAAALFLGLAHFAIVLCITLVVSITVILVRPTEQGYHIPLAACFFPAYCLSLMFLWL